MQAWCKKNGVVSIVMALLLALTACSPRFDWREISNPGAGYVALFPARPVEATRPVQYDTHTLQLTLQTAEVDEMRFAVGYAQLPAIADKQPPDGATWVSLFETALLQNLNAQITQANPPPAPAVRDINANGTLRVHRKDMHGVPAKMRARFYVQQGQLYEVLVIAATADWNEEAAETFMAGFQIKSGLLNVKPPQQAARF